VWDEAKEKAGLELHQLENLVEINSTLLRQLASKEPGQIELLAVAAILHSFYTGIENIFRRIALEIDRSPPDTSYWHKDLLDSMASINSSRKAVISGKLKDQLSEYLAFRHTFRHLYSFQLDWKKMKHLALNIQVIYGQFESEIKEFFSD
jgi:hypothetical protein